MKTKDYNIEQYLKILSSANSTPGGGSLSALQGSLAAGLICMVCNLTIGKNKYKIYDNHNKKILSKCQILKDKFLELADDDVNSFNNFMQTLNQNDAASNRNKLLQSAYKQCCTPPIQIIDNAINLLKDLNSILQTSNKMALSDLGCSANLIESCMKNAALTLNTNLAHINDKSYCNVVIQRTNDKLLWCHEHVDRINTTLNLYQL